MYNTKLSIVLATILVSGIIGLGGCGGGSTSTSESPHIEEEGTTVNHPPVISSAASVNAAENQNIAIDVDATDADGDTLVYTIEGGPDAASVVMDSSTGKVIFITTPDFETKNSYQFTVGVSDGSAIATQDVTINITDIAEGSAPIITSSSEIYADENQKHAFTVTATDIDGDTITYSLEGGADAVSFDINANSGEVLFKNEPDFETKNLYLVTVGASDATDTTTQSITVHINDLDGTSNVVQTGQTIKYADGDDGDIRAGKARSFTDTGSFSVVDHTTNLEWKDNSFIKKTDYSTALTYCSTLSLDGKNDWYLPSIDQLYTIADRGAHNPAIFNVFDHTKNDMYWANTNDFSNNAKAYVLNFSDGTDFTTAKTDNKYVRCVRKYEVPASAIGRVVPVITPVIPILPIFRYSKVGQIVNDHYTKLQWYDNLVTILGHEILPVKQDWEHAVAYCYTLSYDGKNDWRLPNINELLSITEKQATTTVKASSIFDSLTADIFWSSTTSDKDPQKAWIVDFATGQDAINGSPYKKDQLHHVRCVRTMGD